VRLDAEAGRELAEGLAGAQGPESAERLLGVFACGLRKECPHERLVDTERYARHATLLIFEGADDHVRPAAAHGLPEGSGNVTARAVDIRVDEANVWGDGFRQGACHRPALASWGPHGTHAGGLRYP
jgi:hypothetical protein